MTVTIKRTVSIGMVVALLFSGMMLPTASAGGLPFATEFTQLLNNIALIESYATQVQQLEQQIQQFEVEVRQATQLNIVLYSNVIGAINGAEQLVKVGKGIAYNMSNLDAEWNITFAGQGYQDQGNFAQKYQQVNQATMDSMKGTLNVVNQQGDDLDADAAMVQNLQIAAQSGVDGSLQALQSLEQICAQMLSEQMKLRQLMLADLQSKEAWQAQQIASQTAGQQVGVVYQLDPSLQNYDSSTPFPQSFKNAMSSVDSGSGADSN